VVEEETWDVEDELGTGYKTPKSPGIAYFVLHFIPDEQQIISRPVCNESTKTTAFVVVVCGGGCRCQWRQYSECLLQHLALFPSCHLLL
jgi:hypothetical protein